MTTDPFGFIAAINFDAVDKHLDVIARILGIDPEEDK